MTMGDFVALALQNELHPILNIQEGKTMENMRTMALQVPEELFQKIKDYLQRNNMTQKQFVIGLIENEINRDLAQRQTANETPAESGEIREERTEQQETAAVSDCEAVSDEVEEQSEEQENADFSYGFDDENEESENPDEDESEDQDECMGMAMGM